MKTNEILKLFEEKELLDKVYKFAYNRCNTSYEAEDLCSDIILATLSAVRKYEEIDNFYAFLWTVARRVYADRCEKQNKTAQTVSVENSELPLASDENEIDDLIEELSKSEQMKKILTEISFLSKAYREVMVMYYIDEIKVKDIALKLGIEETTVKQRLFSARNTIRKEVESMNNRNVSLKPVNLFFLGSGSPVGNDPSHKAERILSQNLVYLCKDKAKSAKELAEELGIPTVYVEEELEIQCRGENGKYGLLRKLENGKYISNVIICDYEEYKEATKICTAHLPELCGILKENIEKNKDAILSVPYLSEQKDVGFILWSLISHAVLQVQWCIDSILKEKYFYDVKVPKRPYTTAIIAATDNATAVENDILSHFYGRDGISANNVCGYKDVAIDNIYGKKIAPHFRVGHDIYRDKSLLLTIKSIGGLSIDSLTEEEKEVAAKAIKKGYLRKTGDTVEPKIIVLNDKDRDALSNILSLLAKDMGRITEAIAKDIASFMRDRIPTHLMNEYKTYASHIACSSLISSAIDECLNAGLLSVPEEQGGAEGVMMVVTE